MARPRVYEDLVTTSVKVDRKALYQAMDRGINISELLRDALTLALRSPTGKVPKTQAAKRFIGVPVPLKNKAMKHAGLDPRTAEAWANIINNRCNTSLKPKDILDMIPKC
jgi:hypothetical protein